MPSDERENQSPGRSTDPMDSVRETANDAVTSKLAASAKGYYHDPFASRLAEPLPPGPPPRRMPLMNRGTWARVAAIDRIVGEK